jgi:hypothetical protein
MVTGREIPAWVTEGSSAAAEGSSAVTVGRARRGPPHVRYP